MNKIAKNRGFMVVEILVATSIIVVFLLVAMAVAQKSMHVSRQALHSIQASFLLEEGAENARISRDNSWSNIATLDTSEQIGIFSRTVVASDACRNVSDDDLSLESVCSGSTYSDEGTKLITVNVNWVEGGQTINKTLKFYLMDLFS